jgi:hypothetical protein
MAGAYPLVKLSLMALKVRFKKVISVVEANTPMIMIKRCTYRL